jgi:hypothetical protein
MLGAVQVARVLLGVAALALSAGAARFTPSVSLGWRHEPGVESKMLVSGLAGYEPCRYARLAAGLGLSLFQHNGINAYALGASALPLGNDRLSIDVAVQHQQWSDWQAGENRLLGSVHAAPLSRLNLRLGAAYRAPVFDPGSYASPFHWHSEVSEWNLLYGIDWCFYSREPYSASVLVSNFELLSQHNAQQFPFGLRGQYSSSGGYMVSGRLSSAITGFSAALVTFSEFVFEAGVSRGF